jgi:hypothetical protein
VGKPIEHGARGWWRVRWLDEHRVLHPAGFASVQRNGKDRSYVRFHDPALVREPLGHARRRHVQLQRILGHQSIQMTMRYAATRGSARASW